MEILEKLLELSVGVLGTVIAAFMGARVAFRLERKRDRDAQQDSEADGLQSAIFVLCRQMALVQRLQTEVLEPLRHDRNRDIRVPAAPGRLLLNARVDFDWISHMLRDHEESAALAFLMMSSDDGVESLHEIIETRRQFHATRIQPKLEEAGITEFSEAQAQHIRYVSGATDSELLQRYTDRLYAACDLAVEQLDKALSEAQRVSRSAFPDYQFKFVLPDWVAHVGSALPAASSTMDRQDAEPMPDADDPAERAGAVPGIAPQEDRQDAEGAKARRVQEPVD